MDRLFGALVVPAAIAISTYLTKREREREREREEYRGQDRFTRDVATVHADHLGSVVAAIANDPQNRGPVQQLAQDLSGRFGPFVMSWQSVSSAKPTVEIEGQIINDERASVGICERTFYRDANRYLIVSNDYLKLEAPARGLGFATALYNELETYYRRSGVDVITIHAALENGGYTWARRGFDWNPMKLGQSFANIRTHIDQQVADSRTHPDDQQLLREMREALDENDPGEEWPTPNELAQLRGVDPQLGRKLMIGTNWYGILPLSERGYLYGT